MECYLLREKIETLRLLECTGTVLTQDEITNKERIETQIKERERELSTIREQVKNYITSLELALNKPDGASDKTLSEDSYRFYCVLSNIKNKTYQTVVAEVRKHEVYRNILYYNKWLAKAENGEPDFSDERISKLIHDISECQTMSLLDKNAFEKVVKVICEPADIDLYLAGHIHAYAEYPNKNESGTDEEGTRRVRHILIADRFYDGTSGEVQGYFIKRTSQDSHSVNVQKLNGSVVSTSPE